MLNFFAYIKKKLYFCGRKTCLTRQLYFFAPNCDFQNRVQRYEKKMRNTNKSVKKHQSYWVLLLAVLFSGTVEARVSVNNYLGGYVEAGEWSLLPKNSSYKPSLGAAGGAGFLYELRLGRMYSSTRFLLDVGVGAQYGWTSYKQSSSALVELGTLKPEDNPGVPVQYDLNGDPFVYVYDIQNRHDQYQNLAVQVPLMVGFQHRKFYMLAGAKIDANLYTKAFTTANLSTYGRYEDVDDMRNKPEYQFFENIPLKKDTATHFNLGVNVSVEIGGRLGLVTEAMGYDVPKQTVECRLAGFVDYGITDIRPKRSLDGFSTSGVKYDTDPTSSTYVYKSTSMVDKLEVNDIMATSNFASIVNNLVIGLKFTILFQLPEEGTCVLCQDGYQSLVRGGRRGGVKYEE